MLNKMAAFLLFVLSFVYPVLSSGQTSGQDSKVQMADGLRSSGKIYVVVAVLLTILSGIVFYIIRLDRKITKLEHGNRDKTSTN
ncbi:MAG: hypothetical protein H7Y03_09370 [Chitinophagaceae bacterium]|nr:hypothetical protein [Chitinophagaceae bacterium]